MLTSDFLGRGSDISLFSLMSWGYVFIYIANTIFFLKMCEFNFIQENIELWIPDVLVTDGF